MYATRDSGLNKSGFSQRPQDLYQSNIKKTTFSNNLTTNSPSSNSILKQTNKNSSLAASHGILRKDPANVTKEGLGMNPNLNVEDEYIENLLKQIHFLGLEIKLLKEKQEEDKGRVGYTGNFGNDKKPIVEHLLDSENKFINLKQNLDEQLILSSNRLLKLDNENKRLLAVKDLMINKLEILKKQHDEMIQNNETILNEAKVKANLENRKRKEDEEKLFNLSKNSEKVFDEHQKNKKEQDIRKINKDLADELTAEEEKMYKEDDEFKTEIIKKLEEDINLKKEEMKSSFKFVELSKENNKLQDRLKESERELDDINYKVLELDHLQALSIKQKEQEGEERKKLAELIERLQEDLEDQKKTNNLKIEKKLRETDSPEIRKLQEAYKAQEAILQDLKAKFQKADGNMKKLKIEMYHKSTYLEDLLASNEEIKEQTSKLNGIAAPQQQKIFELREKVKEDSLRLVELKDDRKQLLTALHKLEIEYAALDSGYKHYAENVKLDSDLQNVDLEQLNKLTNSNNRINESIQDLLSRWDQISKFSRNVAPAVKHS